MKWSPQQDKALVDAAAFLKSDHQVHRIFGYAGTGKTTLARHIAQDAGNVLFAAYTGKAAHVLQTKGCAGASTIHSLIYTSRDRSKKKLKEMEEAVSMLSDDLDSDDLTQDSRNKIIARIKDINKLLVRERENASKPAFNLNPESVVREADLVIIDECSMIDAAMGADLLSFGTKILVLGDPAQLPPIGGAGYFTEGVTPDTMLDEIHRQAEDSPIIRMATDTRLGKQLDYGSYGDGCRVIMPKDVVREMATGADQILVGKNKTRFSTNSRIRSIKGLHDPYPVPGDRLVCLRNNHELGLLNGAIFYVVEVGGVMDSKVLMTIRPEDGESTTEVLAHEHYFLGKGDELNWFEKKEAEEFDFGYALTVHKSQGSQWNSVYLTDESHCFRSDRWRWLYTGITRAAEELTVVR
jgi:exodeoxyribonuclease-5